MNWPRTGALITFLLMGCGNDKTTPPAGDITPPSAISDLAVRALGAHSVLLARIIHEQHATEGFCRC